MVVYDWILFFCLVEEEKCVEEREGEKGTGLSGGSLTRWGMGAVDYLTITKTFFYHNLSQQLKYRCQFRAPR